MQKKDEDNILYGPQSSGSEDPEHTNPDATDKKEVDDLDGDDRTTDDKVYTDTYVVDDKQYTVLIVTDAGGNDVVVLSVYGGVMLSTRGKVVSDSYDFTSIVATYDFTQNLTTKTAEDAMDVEFVSTSPSFCFWPINPVADGGNGFSTAEYICYYGGDCYNGFSGFTDSDDDGIPDDSDGDGIADDGCQRDVESNVIQDTILAQDNVNGGWYGKVGIILVDDNQGNRE